MSPMRGSRVPAVPNSIGLRPGAGFERRIPPVDTACDHEAHSLSRSRSLQMGLKIPPARDRIRRSEEVVLRGIALSQTPRGPGGRGDSCIPFGVGSVAGDDPVVIRAISAASGNEKPGLIARAPKYTRPDKIDTLAP
jgi:hypothetical protein